MLNHVTNIVNRFKQRIYLHSSDNANRAHGTFAQFAAKFSRTTNVISLVNVLSPISHIDKDHSIVSTNDRRTKNYTKGDNNIHKHHTSTHQTFTLLTGLKILVQLKLFSQGYKCRPCPKLPSNMVKEDGVQTHVLLLLQVSRKAK